MEQFNGKNEDWTKEEQLKSNLNQYKRSEKEKEKKPQKKKKEGKKKGSFLSSSYFFLFFFEFDLKAL